jgi:hypothetical protein
MLKFILFLCMLLVMGNMVFAQFPEVWLPAGMGGGGAVYAPAISPFNPDEAWLSCDMSVVSHTSDFGQHWRREVRSFTWPEPFLPMTLSLFPPTKDC